MRTGIILHGPEIIDVGSARRIIGIFRQEHDTIAKLGGTMGRTAVLDAGLENIIDISQGLTPSETITALKDKIDLAILLNHGKTLETGRYFGRIIASRLNSSCIVKFVHIERPDMDGRIIYYDPLAKRCAEYVRNILAKRYGTYEPYDLPIEKGTYMPSNVRFDGDTIIRQISGAFPGENIRLDGIVIGEVTRPELEIVCKDGRVIELRGGRIKPHGLEKLDNRKIDLSTAKVKTGNIRRSQRIPRIAAKESRSAQRKNAALIDHCAESTFELIQDANLVITVGDDTTAISADILTRFGIPVIGITDGDLDGVLPDTAVPAGSVIVRVMPGFDDILGREVFLKLMNGKQWIEVRSGDEMLAQILALGEKYIADVKYY